MAPSAQDFQVSLLDIFHQENLPAFDAPELFQTMCGFSHVMLTFLSDLKERILILDVSISCRS